MKEVAFGKVVAIWKGLHVRGALPCCSPLSSSSLARHLLLYNSSLKEASGYLALSHCSPYIVDKITVGSYMQSNTDLVLTTNVLSLPFFWFSPAPVSARLLRSHPCSSICHGGWLSDFPTQLELLD